MMAQDYETISFFVLAGGFDLLERWRPAREIDRWRDLKIDVFSFALAVTMNRISHYSVTFLIEDEAPTWLRGGLHALQGLPAAARIFLAILLVDFIIYWLHRAQHRFDLLWRTHAWHHSIEQLYWFSGFRTSFLHSLLYNIPQAAVPMLVFNLSPYEAGIGYSIGLLIQFWEHTNIDIPIGPLQYVFITPAYHRVHHSASDLCRRNFGTTFSLWDRMFGTYVNPETVPASTPLGLGAPLEKKKIPRMLIGI
ncbi:MAG TPA: sterol desaturase family protein [Opitutaceae bacterium]|nr:sterol desaturase family protein [Opitutaceae bacterium]